MKLELDIGESLSRDRENCEICKQEEKMNWRRCRWVLYYLFIDGITEGILNNIIFNKYFGDFLGKFILNFHFALNFQKKPPEFS